MENVKNIAIIVLLAVVVIGFFLSRRKRPESASGDHPPELESFSRPDGVPRPFVRPTPDLQEVSETPEPPEPPLDYRKLESELTVATDVATCWELFKQVPADDPFEKKALDKIRLMLRDQLKLATTTDEALEVVDDSDEEEELEQIETDALTRSLELAVSIDDCFSVFDKVPDRLEETLCPAALEKALSLATTFDECITVHDKANEYDVGENHVKPSLEKALTLATTFEECDTLLENVSDDDDLEALVAARQLDFVDTVEQCEEVWGNYDNDSQVFRAAVCRAADLIRAEDGAEHFKSAVLKTAEELRVA